MTEHRLITIKTYNDEIEAGMDKSLLESEGLLAFVVKSDLGTTYLSGGVGGVELRVPEDAVEEAREILGI